MTRYIGLDAHANSCTFGVLDERGRRLRHAVVETDAGCLIEFVKRASRPRYVCLEEGTQSAWLYEVLSPHSDEVIVTTIGQSRGNRDDKRDAFKVAEKLRTGSVTPVYKERGPFSQLICVARVHEQVGGDRVRTQGRLKALYRSRGVKIPDDTVYAPKHRPLWLDKLPAPYRPAAELLYTQLDAEREVEQRVSG